MFKKMIGVIIFTIIAFIISIILVNVSNKVDKKIDKKEEIFNLLPHYNCGVCGFINCDNMALKILENKDNVLKCKPMKNKEEVINKINDILK